MTDEDDSDATHDHGAAHFFFDDEEDHPRPTYIFPPQPHILVPDYRFLAAARIVIEANLRGRLEEAVEFAAEHDGPQTPRGLTESEADRLLGALRSLDVVRMGGAPGFWDQTSANFPPRAWRVNAEDHMDVEPVPSSSQTSDHPTPPVTWEEDPDGWDWAGMYYFRIG
jgi:hypothetical protein